MSAVKPKCNTLSNGVKMYDPNQGAGFIGCLGLFFGLACSAMAIGGFFEQRKMGQGAPGFLLFLMLFPLASLGYGGYSIYKATKDEKTSDCV
jgi:hypothetical protein